MRSHQAGLGLISLIFWLMVAAFVFITVAKVVPSYFEYYAIKRAFQDIASDSQLVNASRADIITSFQHHAEIDNITSIKGSDIQIDQQGGQLHLSASYQVQKPVIGNMGIYFDFNPSSQP